MKSINDINWNEDGVEVDMEAEMEKDNKRNEEMSSLMQNFLNMNPAVVAGDADYEEYKKYMDGKSDQEIANIYAINFIIL